MHRLLPSIALLTALPCAAQEITPGGGAACDLGSGTTMVERLDALPAPLAQRVKAFFAPVGGIAEAGAAYNATDVVDTRLPARRFVRAYHAGGLWVLWYARGGGIVSMRLTLAFHPDPQPGAPDGYAPMPGTTLAGDDQCLATRAVLGGVRSGTP